LKWKKKKTIKTGVLHQRSRNRGKGPRHGPRKRWGESAGTTVVPTLQRKKKKKTTSVKRKTKEKNLGAKDLKDQNHRIFGQSEKKRNKERKPNSENRWGGKITKTLGVKGKSIP